MLTIDRLTYRVDGRILFEEANLRIPAGTRAGFVGRNGTGKSTLFRLILKEIAADDGDIRVHHLAKVGAVAQEAEGNQVSILQTVLDSDREMAALLAEAETAQDANRISEIHMRLADIDSYTAEARATSVLVGLGFPIEQHGDPCASLSGGWRMRVALAGMLFAQPDLLLLDEPTNYLDLEGTLWLENYLMSYPYTVIIISHDRELLEKSVSSIIHLENQKLKLYTGSYSTFERTREMQAELLAKSAVKQKAAMDHMQKYIDRFRYKASKAKQAQSRIKKLDKMKPISLALNSDVASFTFPNPEKKLPAPLISMQRASTGYGDTVVLDNLNLRIEPDDRIALIGPNGNGKSTFAKLICGRLDAMGGDIVLARKMRTAFFAQHQLDDLHPEDNPIQHIRPLMPGAPENKVRGRVAQMGLSAAKMETKVANLSGGERARLLMGLATFVGPHLLILDEPTNHLDIDSRQALIQALNEFEGAVLIISHDRHIIEATVDTLWIAENGTVERFDDDLDAYQQRILSSASKPKKGRVASAAPQGGGEVAKKNTAPLKNSIRNLEKKIAKHQRGISEVDAKLSAGDLFNTDPIRASRLTKERMNIEKRLGKDEAEWMDLSEQLEAS